MNDQNGETITITLKRSTLERLFAGGNYSVTGVRALSQSLALNAIDHHSKLLSKAAEDSDHDEETDRLISYYLSEQLNSVTELVDAVALAEEAEVQS